MPYVRFVVKAFEALTLAAGTYSNPNEYGGNGAAGAVEAGGSMTAPGVVSFVDNRAVSTKTADSYGGALVNDGLIQFSSVSFSTNNACYGGAFVNRGTMTIEGQSSFVGNSSQDGGGAIYNVGNCDLSSVAEFSDNATDYDGGALCNEAEVVMSGAVFSGNTAKRLGGAICNSDTLTFTGKVTFSGNQSKTGGAICNSGTVTIADGTFTENSSTENGGAIENTGDLTIAKGRLENNSAGKQGGAIHNAGTLALSDANFVNNAGALWNSAVATLTNVCFTGADNAIYNYGGTVTAFKVSFDGLKAGASDHALTSSGGTVNLIGGKFTGYGSNYGGTVGNYSSTVSLTDISFVENGGANTWSGGGIILFSGQSYLAAKNCRFVGNSAVYGGGIRNWGTAWVAESVFEGNVGGNGAALYNDGTIEMVDDTFGGNTASYGGAVNNAGRLTLAGGSFSANTARERGGALANFLGATVDGTVFSENQAKAGGAIYNVNGSSFYNYLLTVSNATFSGNTATDSSGGAIYNSGSMVLSKTTLAGNTSVEVGGAIYNAGGKVTLDGVTFDGNKGPKNEGGAIYNADRGTVTLTGKVFLNTFRDTIHNVGKLVWSCENGNGGYLSDYSLLTNEGTLAITIDMDVADSRMLAGNAASAEGQTFTISGLSETKGVSIAVGGEAVDCGGVTCRLSVSEGNLVLTTEKEYSRIVVASGETRALASGTYHNATVSVKSGAAAVVKEGGVLTGKGVVFSENAVSMVRSASGGAIDNAGALTLCDAAFEYNSCTATYDSYSQGGNAYGGAIYNAASGVLTLADVTFSGNAAVGSGYRASGYGGAIYNDGGMVNLKSSVTLATDSDTWVNGGSGRVNWDLTAGIMTYGSINGYQYYRSIGSNVRQTISVTADQAPGRYTLATGSFDAAKLKENKSDAFYLTVDGETFSEALTVGGSGVMFEGVEYLLELTDGELRLKVGDVPPSTSTAVCDYNGSGKSDMIQFVNGLVYVTRDTKNGYEQTPAINDVTGWSVVETRRDLTGDNVADIQITADAGDGTTWVALLRNDYQIYGRITLNYQFIGAYDNALWSYLGSADVNGDGKAEVLMAQTAAGADQYGHRNVAAWVTDSEGKWVGNEWVGALESNWNIAGTADLDGNGTDDVILRRNDGMIGYWNEAGSNEIVEIAESGSNVLITTGDFSGDGADDFLFTNDSGDFLTWSDVGGALKSETIGNVGDLGGNWRFAGVGDYNGDGTDEILWFDSLAGSIAYGEANSRNFAKLTPIVQPR